MCTQGGRESYCPHTFKEGIEILQRLKIVLENFCLGLLLGLLLLLSVRASCVFLIFTLLLVNCCFLDSVNIREVGFIFWGYSMQKSTACVLTTETSACISAPFMLKRTKENCFLSPMSNIVSCQPQQKFGVLLQWFDL